MGKNKIKEIKNYIYDKWMNFLGYTAYGFNFKTNDYIYEKKTEIEKWIKTEENDGIELEVHSPHEDAPKLIKYLGKLYIRLDIHGKVIESIKNRYTNK